MGRSRIVGALPRLPLEVLRHVVLIAECGSTVGAAQIVNMTSSSLSRKIAQLEHDLGVPLFERHSRGMRPTSAGQLVAEAARQILARMDRLASDIGDVDELGRGLVRIYASQALVEHFLMPHVARMAVQYPNVKIELHVGAGRQAERALIDESADFALILTVPRHPEIEIVAERANRIVAIVSPDHPLAERGRISVAEVLAQPFAALPPSYSSRAAFNTLAPEALLGVQPQFTANSIAALKAYALAGLGVAIVPELTVGDAPGEQGLVLIEIIGSERTDTRMCLCRRQSRLLGNAARRLLNDFVTAFAPQPASPIDAEA